MTPLTGNCSWEPSQSFAWCILVGSLLESKTKDSYSRDKRAWELCPWATRLSGGLMSHGRAGSRRAFAAVPAAAMRRTLHDRSVRQPGGHHLGSPTASPLDSLARSRPQWRSQRAVPVALGMLREPQSWGGTAGVPRPSTISRKQEFWGWGELSFGWKAGPLFGGSWGRKIMFHLNAVGPKSLRLNLRQDLILDSFELHSYCVKTGPWTKKLDPLCPT